MGLVVTERQKLILDKIVKEYIDSAWPVSSQLLEKKYNFGLSPATIRIEMQKLTDQDYLYQPHTSAGRIPTDRGYRSFVDNLLERGVSEFQDIFKIEEFVQKEKEDIVNLIAHLSKFLAAASSNLAAIHLLEKDLIWKEGWQELLREPEFGEKEFVSDFAEFLENFEENVKALKINSGIKIYIGRENPLSKAKDFSIISSKCHLPDDEEGIVSLLGPTRMAYDRNISLIYSLTRFLAKV